MTPPTPSTFAPPTPPPLTPPVASDRLDVPPASPPAAAPSRRSTVATAVVSSAATAALLLGLNGVVADSPTAVPSATAPAGQADPDPGGTSATNGERLSVVEVAERVSPSVAAVAVTGPGGQGSGTAVILDADGYLLTNEHVVDGASQVTVQLPDGGQHVAEVVGTDPRSDLAVLRIDVTGLPAATFAEALPRIGETAVAIGSPFGLQGSVSAGIVSALDRNLPSGATSLIGLIQTDAAINPGNSGGALVNDRGEVIGINTAILSSSGTNDGVGFAIAAPDAINVAERLLADGEIRYALLGVRGQDVDATLAESYGLDAAQGALIVEVTPDSGAAAAGLAADDIVVSYDGRPITSMSELAVAVRRSQPGDTVTLGVLRDGQEVDLTITLGEAPPA